MAVADPITFRQLDPGMSAQWTGKHEFFKPVSFRGPSANVAGEIRLHEPSSKGQNFTGLRAPGALSQDLMFTLPNNLGSNGQVLTTDGSGNMSWSAAGSGSVTGSGTTNTVPKWTSSTVLGDSAITDDGTDVTITSRNLHVGTGPFSFNIDLVDTDASRVVFRVQNTNSAGQAALILVNDSGGGAQFAVFGSTDSPASTAQWRTDTQLSEFEISTAAEATPSPITFKVGDNEGFRFSDDKGQAIHTVEDVIGTANTFLTAILTQRQVTSSTPASTDSMGVSWRILATVDSGSNANMARHDFEWTDAAAASATSRYTLKMASPGAFDDTMTIEYNLLNFGTDQDDAIAFEVRARGGSSGQSIFRQRQDTNAATNLYEVYWGQDSSGGYTAPAAGRNLWNFIAYAGDDAGTPNETQYAKIIVDAKVVTSGSEEGEWIFQVQDSGSLTTMLAINPTGVGVGTANHDVRLQVDGSANINFRSSVSDAGTTTVVTAGAFRHITSGTAAASFGVQTRHDIEDAGGTERTASTYITQWVDAAAVSRRSRSYLTVTAGASDEARVFEIEGTATAAIANWGFIQGGSSADYGGGRGVIFIQNAGTNPSSNPTGGGDMYSTGGAGTWRGSGGTVTTFGPAEPYCEGCHRDAWRQAMYNEEENWHLYECGWCGMIYKSGDAVGEEKLGKKYIRAGMSAKQVASLMAA